MSTLNISTNFSLVEDCKLTNDERVLFDWLVFMQERIGLGTPFNHSIAQIEKRTKTSRFIQEKAFSKFSELGFLTIGKHLVGNNPYKSFHVNFQVLSKDEVLGWLYADGKTYKNRKSVFQSLAEQQKSDMNRTDYEQESNVNGLYTILSQCWKERIELYNNGELQECEPECQKRQVMLSCDRKTLDKLCNVLDFYDKESVKCAFTAYADEVLTGDIEPDKILPYFLHKEDGDFVVVDRFLDKFNICYRVA